MKTGKKRVFYGYFVVGAGFFISLVLWGAFNSFGVFFKPMSGELGWSRAVTSGAYSLAFFMYGLVGIFAGRQTDKWGARAVEITCGVLLGLGYFLMARVDSAWQLYLYYGIILGAGFSGGEGPLTATVARWFSRRRGTFIGFTKTGAGVGNFVGPVIAASLVGNFGWRNAYDVIAAACLVGIVSVALLFKRDPSEVGQFPDGMSAAESVAAAPSEHTRDFSLRESFRTRQFWLLSAAWLLIDFSALIILAHIVPHMTDVGISPPEAATIFGIIGAASLISRLSIGYISDRLGRIRTFLVGAAFLTASLVLLQFAHSAWTFYLFATLDGIAHGAMFTLISVVVAELFGLKSLGFIFGAIMFFGTLSGALGPVLAGYIFDVTRNYQIAFITCLAASIVTLFLIFFIRPTKTKSA